MVTSLTNQMKAAEQCVPVVLSVIILYKWIRSNLHCANQKNCGHFELILISICVATQRMRAQNA